MPFFCDAALHFHASVNIQKSPIYRSYPASTTRDWPDGTRRGSDPEAREVAELASDAVTMRLASTAATLEAWPHRFSCAYTVTLDGESLVTSLKVVNEGDEPMTFTTALHTYFKVDDATQARVEGLKAGRAKINKIKNFTVPFKKAFSTCFRAVAHLF